MTRPAPPPRTILVIDVGGTHVKILATGRRTPRRCPSGAQMTAPGMVAAVKRLAAGWTYEAIAMGYPGPVLHGKIVAEPHNLADGWVGFDFAKAFGCPVKIINDAAMQALGSYRGGRMLFLGLGTGLGTALIVNGIIEPMELAHLPYKKGKTFEDYVGERGLKRLGRKKWQKHVLAVARTLKRALEADDAVLGGGNARRLDRLPRGFRLGRNANAFAGGFRLWTGPRPRRRSRGARPLAHPRGRVDVLPDLDALTVRAAERFVAAATQAVRTSGRFTVALSGGATPERLYALLATPEYAARVDWPRTHVCWGDERCVPPTDSTSNFRLAHDALLRHVPVPDANVHRIPGELDPAAAATRYEKELRDLFAPSAGRSPGARFDLVLLGLGANGHTASLFPGLRAVRERDRWVVAEYVPAVSMWRVTLTPVAINAAAEVLFLVSGREKAPALRRVLLGRPDAARWPAQAVAPGHHRLRWLVDAAAAESLSR